MKFTKFFALLCAAAATLVSCEPTPSNEQGPETEGSLRLEADKTAVSLGETVTMTVWQEGVDVTDKSTIYDADMNAVPATFTPLESGSYTFFATKGSESSNNLVITVLATMPDVPEDTEPSNTKFNHRVVVIDHTGMNCPYCPSMIDKLMALAKTEWHQHYNEVTCHAGNLAGNDPANSPAATILNQTQSRMIEGYPNICINIHDAAVGNYGESVFLRYMAEEFTRLVKKGGADVGIALAVEGDSQTIYCAAQVKAAVEQEYLATAWLLESNIYSPGQSGASQDYHKIYDFALRNMAGEYKKDNVQGESIGVLAVGETKDLAFELPIISNKWQYENMDVLVIVSAKNSNNVWEIVNSAMCHIGEAKPYEYVK